MRQYIPTIKYSWLQGSFWMSFCIVFSYANLYLLSCGYTASQIGIVIAAAGVISTILQPLAAGLADGDSKITLRSLILVFSLVMLACAAILMIPGIQFLWYALFYGILLAVLQILTPLVNAIGMEYFNKGIAVNFGLARGIGSISYAAISFVAGILIERFSAGLVPVLIIFCYLLVFFAAFFFRFPLRYQASAQQETEKTEASASAELPFFVQYRKFFVLLIGVSLIFICHNILNNYMYQVMLYHNGGSTEMGIASGIAAALELPTMIAFSYMVKKVSSGNLLKISGVFFTLKAALTLLAPGIGGVYLAQTMQIFGFALQVPASVYYTNSLIRPGDRAKGQALMTATNTVGSIFGSLLGGFLIDEKGIHFTLLIATILAAFGTLLMFFTVEKCEEKL